MEVTQEQAKLTLTDLVGLIGGYDSVEAYLQHISTSTRGYTTTERLLARALLASQTALRQARSDLIAAGMFDSAKEVEAALLDQGGGDE